MSEEQQHCVPQQVINQIGEYSPAGFILFVMNPHGSPEAFHCYDSDMSALALQSFARLWNVAIRDMQHDKMSQSINPPPPPKQLEEED